VAAVFLAVIAAYINGLRAPFVLDDISAIAENPTIRTLWPPWGAVSPPASGTTVSGRPVANLTLAFNHALSGLDPRSYHALNILIHALGGLTLFAVVRRTLRLPSLEARYGREATPLSAAIALLWCLHPLQTEAVTYVVQRVESLMALFYLLTLYCFIRSLESLRPAIWRVCAVAACLLGMATKEVAATAPLLVLCYDRAFVAGTFAQAWRKRGGFYLALAATLLPEIFLVAGSGWNRGGSAGFGSPLSPGAYWMVQFEAVLRYLGLSAWPHPLVFDYGTRGAADPLTVAGCALAVGSLALGSVFLFLGRRHAAAGFLGVWFFLILAPTSVVPVATQTMAEHRMYLPLAAVVALFVLGVFSLLGTRSWPLLGLLALGLGILTARRNEDYASAVRLWRDTVSKAPDNARAHCALGFALSASPGGLPEAVAQYEEALRVRPDFPDAHNDLGIALEGMPGRSAESIGHFREALRLNPNFGQAHFNLGAVLARTGRVPEAIPEFEAALKLRPGDAKAHFELGIGLVETGRIGEGVGQFEAALRIQPDFAEAQNNLGIVLCRTGRMAEGIGHIEAAIKAHPDFAPAHFALGAALWQSGRRDEAEAEFDEVLRLRPDDPAARRALEKLRGRP
jgi:tetratricopeptide (TPR) repeat protein